MIYYESIEPTKHYIEHHQQEVPWIKVIEILFKTKNPKKKGDKFEIENDGYYILFEIKEKVLYVINAKKDK